MHFYSDEEDMFMNQCVLGNFNEAIKLLNNDPAQIDTYKVFKYICINGYLKAAMWLHSIKPTINAFRENTFIWSCADGQLKIAKWLLSITPTINISMYNEMAFRYACEHGHLNVAKWLLKLKPTINVSADNEYAFRWACHNGKLYVAKWLLAIKPTINISADNDWAYRCSCKTYHNHVFKWLQSLHPFKYALGIKPSGVITNANRIYSDFETNTITLIAMLNKKNFNVNIANLLTL